MDILTAPMPDLYGCTSPQEAIIRVVEHFEATTGCDAIAAVHGRFLTSSNIDVCPFPGCREAGHVHLGTGPGPNAHREPVRIDDTRTDGRWPQWSSQIAAQGYHSALALGLEVDPQTETFLLILARPAGAFTQSDVDAVSQLALDAQAALGAERTRRRLESLTATQNLVKIAQGILMSRFDLTPSRAAARLRGYSQSTNTKVPLVAQAIIDVRRHHSTALFTGDPLSVDRLIRQTIQELAYEGSHRAYTWSQ